jgi:protein SCO1/2
LKRQENAMARTAPLLLIVLLAAPPAGAGEPAPAEHCAHHAPAAATERSQHAYRLPAVRLVDEDGQPVALADALQPGAPLALNFIFTSCTTVCPVMSASFAAVRARLPASSAVRFVSISIDPEHDRPGVLKRYAARFGRGSAWRFYTGDADDIRTVLAAFGAEVSDKSNHRPFTLLRRAGSSEWVRLDGLASAEALLQELTALQATN